MDIEELRQWLEQHADDISRILEFEEDDELLDQMESALFGGDSSAQPNAPDLNFQIDSAFQGEEGLELVKKSLVDNSPYAVAFIDMKQANHHLTQKS